MPTRFDDPAWLLEERRWVRRARAGDRDAIGRLYEAFAGPLYQRVLMPRLGDPQAAEDALAETFRAALERLDQFHDRGLSMWSWLARIGVSKAMDQHRARQRAGRALASFLRLTGPLVPAAEDPGLALARHDEVERLREAVCGVLERIHPRYRRALEARFIEDRGREECARLLEVTTSTFDVLLLRALRAFRREWTAAGAARAEEAG